MHSRFTWIQGDTSKVDEAIEQVKRDVLPVLEQADGFKGFTLHVDRSSGSMVGLSYWESEEAMQASEEAVRQGREDAAKTAGGEPRVSRFEVVLDTEA